MRANPASRQPFLMDASGTGIWTNDNPCRMRMQKTVVLWWYASVG